MSQNFQTFLRNEISKMTTTTRNESGALLLWFLENIFCLDRDIAISVICDGHKDKGIDGIYIDEIEEIIYVFQSKYKQNDDRHIGDATLRDFSGVKEWFKSAETVESLKVSTINKELKSLIETNKLEELVDAYTIEYHYVSNAFKNHDTTEYIKVNNDVEIWDLDSIKKGYYEVKDDPLVQGCFAFKEIDEKYKIEYTLESGLKTIIMPVKASELMGLQGISDMTLFNKNVRFGLGNTRVNKSIKKTLEDTKEKTNFLLFHNGISLVCERLNYISELSELKIENYSVVNGAQSILSFYNNSKFLDDSVVVLLKISEVGLNSDLTILISKYNNNQNSISMRDLRSNDKVQNRIVKDFERLSKKFDLSYTYVPKRRDAIDKNSDIQSDYAGQLIESCYLFKPYNTHLKSAMFDSRYNDIFTKNITANRILVYFDADRIYSNILNTVCDDNIASYGLAKYFILSTLFKLIKEEKRINSLLFNEDNYFSDRKKWHDFIEKCFALIIKIFNKYIRNLNKNDNFIYKNYFKSASQTDKLYEDIRSDFYGLLELDDIDFVGLLKKSGKEV